MWTLTTVVFVKLWWITSDQCHFGSMTTESIDISLMKPSKLLHVHLKAIHKVWNTIFIVVGKARICFHITQRKRRDIYKPGNHVPIQLLYLPFSQLFFILVISPISPLFHLGLLHAQWTNSAQGPVTVHIDDSFIPLEIFSFLSSLQFHLYSILDSNKSMQSWQGNHIATNINEQFF